MGALLLSVSAIIASFSFLLAGNSLQSVVLGLRAALEGFSPTVVGIMMACYFAGFAVGSVAAPRVIARVGYIRAFAAFASAASGIFLMHPLWVDPVPWSIARFIVGFCFAGLYAVVEGWLNASSTNALRGRILSIYAGAVFLGFAVGPLLANLGPVEGFFAFVVASMIVSFSLVPVTLADTQAPAETVAAPIGPGLFLELLRSTPLGFVGALSIGAVQGTFISLAPTFGTGAGFGKEMVAAFMSASLFAGLLVQFPVGWLSDVIDRRKVIAGIAIAGGAASLAVTATGLDGETPFLTVMVAATIIGATIYPLYAIVVAYTNDWISDDQRVAIAAALILVGSIGSMIGTLVVSYLMQVVGPMAFTGAIGAIMIALGVFAVLRSFVRAAPEQETDYGYATAAVVPGTIPLDFSTPLEEVEEDGVTETDEATEAPAPARNSDSQT
ncbi:MAG: MFS transporter [Pseudomonadota bacterium]